MKVIKKDDDKVVMQCKTELGYRVMKVLLSDEFMLAWAVLLLIAIPLMMAAI